MVMCAYGIRQGTNTVGDFVMINAMMIQLYQPLNFMGMVYREIKQATIDIETMFNILQRPAEIVDRPDAKPLAVRAGGIRFENVGFAYEPARPILKGVSFEVPAGKTVAIVGPSGAGKSTISRLLFRFYDVTTGRILIDGQDIRDVTQTSLRAAIGMVPQDTVLFNDTIRYNIRYGRWEASDAEVEEAARLAQIDGFIRMSPHGYETEVGERGLKLSGGEKQRVAIARTILKAPPILLLDEATSALDSHTEREIQDALELVSQNRTTLVIAHRLSTIVGADEIIVLDNGVIVERGTHHELLLKGGLYASMWNRQREAEEAREKLARVAEDPSRAEPQSAAARRRSRARDRGGIVSPHVHHQLHPLAARAHPSAGLSVHRRLCAGEPDPVLALDAARLDRHAGHGLVRLFLPRSGPRHAAARGPRGLAGRRPRQPGRQRGAAAGTGPERPAAAAHFDLHERVRLPREPQPGVRPDRAHGLSRRQVHQRRSRQGERGQRAQRLHHRDARASASAWCRSRAWSRGGSCRSCARGRRSRPATGSA